MKNATAFPVVLGLCLLLPSLIVDASPTEIEQVYVEAIASTGKEVVTQPHVLVKIGSDATIDVAPGDTTTPRVTLKFLAHASSGSHLTVTVTGLIDGHEATTGVVEFSRDNGGQRTFLGAGYTWKIAAELMTPELMKRKGQQGGR